MAFNRAGIEKAWESIAAKGSALKEGAAELGTKVKNSRAGGMVSDSAAAIHGIGLHTLGGAAMGGTINAAAYANDGAFTSADSGASAFLSGAGYGAAAGMGLGMMHAKKYAAYNAAKRAKSLKQSTYTSAKEQFGMPELPREMSIKDSVRAFDTDLANIRNARAQAAAASMPPVVKQSVKKPAFKLTRDGAAHDLAAQVYEKNVKNSSMPSYNERVARQRRLAWNNRTK